MATVLEFDGSNELRSKLSPHTLPAGTDTRYPFTDFADLYSDAAHRIRKRPGTGAPIGTLPASVVAIHEYVRTDPATGAKTTFQFIAIASAIYRWNGATFVLQTLPYSPAGTYWAFLNFGNRCFAVNGKDQMIVFDGTSWRLVGISAPVASATYALTGTYNVGSVTATTASQTVVGQIPAIWTIATFANKPMTINGIPYTITVVTVVGDGSSIAPQLTITEKFKETTSAGLPYKVFAGVMAWSVGPRYRYSYFNPATGHCSDGSPILEITEQDQLGVTPVITIAGSAQNTSAYNAGYTQIKLFRSPKDGTQMLEIDAVINNRDDGAAIVFTESATTGRDVALTNFAAPAETNKPPANAFAALATWLGRLWGLRPSDPTNTPPDAPRLYFSAITEELSIGLGEESWPRRFAREGIAEPTGLLTVGGQGSSSALVIQASDGDYTLQGYDNLTFTPPYRMSTRRTGGFLGGAIDVEGQLVQLYRDKRLLHGGEDVGAGIQDKLDAITSGAVTLSRLCNFSYESFDVLLVTMPKASMDNSYTLVLDYDQNRMNEWLFGFSAVGICQSSSGAAELWVGRTNGDVHRLLQSGVFVDGTSTQYAPFFRTAPIRRFARTQVRRVHVFVGGAAGAAALTWTLTIRADEDAVGRSVTLLPAPADRQSASGNELLYEFETPVICTTFDLRLTFPATSADLYVEKMTVVIADAQSDMENS